MKVAVIYNKKTIDPKDVINIYGIATKEHYSVKTVERVAASLEAGGHSVKIIEGTMAAVDEMRSFMPKVVDGETPGMVFNMAYGIQGHDRYTHLPAMLEMLGVPYTGSGPEAHAIVQDKVMTKIVLQKNSLPTANFWVFTSPDDEFDDLEFPVIVKPKMESTSMGMTIAYDWSDLRAAVRDEIEKYKQDALVEQFIPGREFAVGILGNRNNLEILPIVEFGLSDPNQIQTKSDKMKNPIGKTCPANLDEDTASEMRNLCAKAFNKLGLHDYSRVDIRMDGDGRMYILELNSMASLGRTGSFVAAAAAAGYTYESLINKMLDIAAVRSFGESHLHGTAVQEGAAGRPLAVAARSYLRSHMRTTVQTLRQVVEVNTSVRNVENINRLGSMLARRLVHLGFSEHLYRQFDVGDIRYYANHDGGRNDVLLLCHTDTPYSARDFMPFKEDRGRISGTGVTESKGGIVVMLSALQALRFARRLRRIRCGILITTDDSLGGVHSQKLIMEHAGRSRFVLGMKWGDEDGSVMTSGYGRDDYQIEISDLGGLRDPDTPDLIPMVARKMASLDRLSSRECRIRMTSMQARVSYGRAFDYASVRLTTHFATKELGDSAGRHIRKALKRQNGSYLNVEVTKGIRRDPVVETGPSMELFRIASGQARSIGIPLKPSTRLASSDISHVPDGIPALDGLGPIGGGTKSPGEYILRDSLLDRALLLSLILSECPKAGSPE